MKTLKLPVNKSEKAYRVCLYCNKFERDCECPNCFTGGSS